MRHIQRSPPDLAMIRLSLPGTSGFELCRTIRSDPVLVHVPILLLCAKPSREDVLKAAEFGVYELVAKPFDPEDLARRVMDLLKPAGVK